MVMRGGSIGVSVYRLALLIVAALVGFGGHLGGMITYGDNYLSDAIRDVFQPTMTSATGRDRPGADGAERSGDRGAEAGGATDLAKLRFPADGKVDFTRDVKPIFATSCYECHGPKKRKGQLRLDEKTAALKGGKGGPLLVAGKPDESQLIERVKGLGDGQPMPLDRDPLPPDCIKILEAWVSQGSQWPDGGVSAAPTEEEKHWAYLPPVRRDPPPSKKHASWARSPIDSFVLAKLESRKLAPSPEADKATLIRRVTLDLTGLPPTPEEVENFLADSRPNAYERLVDRLLASPHYGERWARPWLDLARYADSNGYEKDLGRTIWPYRDWVIDALNADMPFDEFTIEQLAGDLLPSPTRSQLIATGFHRNSMINEEGGVDPEEYRVNAVIDRANATATIWLGSTLGCAQCHDHKFDPFTQKDYYRFFAYFNRSEVESKLTPIGEFLEISPRLTLPDPFGESRREVVKALDSAIHELGGASPEAARLAKDLDDARKAAPAAVTTLVMKDMPEPRKSFVLQRGSFLNPGDEVEPGVPTALAPATEAVPVTVPQASVPGLTSTVPGVFPSEARADRLALAKWLVSPENPLTARVAVNHLWEQHFGRGIVETSEDLGSRGSAPSHPELLDWLATELVRQKWSLKAMHRLIVTSATYRQASHVTPELLESDPQNKWLARGARFRLDAETVRDQALAIGGLLSLKMGGPPVFPVQPDGVWAAPYSDNHWATSAGDDVHRRAIYTYWKRSSPYPQFVSFDAPNRTATCTRRPRTNTPLQALTTLNDPVFMEAAAGLARRILARDTGPEDRMDFAFRAAVARSATSEERNRLLALLQQQAAAFQAEPEAARDLVAGVLRGERAIEDSREWAAWILVANVLLNLDEVLNRG
jgi:hypothetical protein